MPPKLFFSYCWSSTDHEQSVLRLATELRESGIDVVLDKWDLREGQDAHAFMESMVSDPEIKKVALICDQAYVSKANDREGGVGVETQIITPEIYNKHDQSKFVAIVMEQDGEGQPCLPVYYKPRIYIDLSDPSSYASEFEKIVRWAFDEPLHKKPDIGPKPRFLIEDEPAIILATSARFKRAMDSIRVGREHALAATEEYFDVLTEEFEKLRLGEIVEPLDDRIVDIIEAFLPYRDEAVSIFLALAKYRKDGESIRIVHRFLEALLPYMNRPGDVSQWDLREYDGYKFIVHELYLYAIASFIKQERFEAAVYLMTDYYLPGRSDYGQDLMVPWTSFREYLRGFSARDERLRRLSVRADMLKERCKGLPVTFRDLMQTDFVLFLRGCAERESEWWPETLLYAGRYHGACEIFARSQSKQYFEKVAELIACRTKTDLGSLLEWLEEDRRRIPRWQFDSFSPRRLLGYEQLCSKP